MHIGSFDDYRSFTIQTKAALLIPADGTPIFSARQEKELTTLAVTSGVVTMQVDNPDLRSINIGPGEQVSLNLTQMGPLVVAGSPPTLTEPKILAHRLLDLHQWQVCETRKGQKEICGTWSWNRSQQQFDATWANGAQGILKIEKMEKGEIVLNRKDTSGLTARYSGRSNGNKILGDVVFQVLEGTVTWTTQGATSEGTWNAVSSDWLDLNAS